MLFDGPGSIAVDGHGDVYVVEVANARVQKLSSTGKRLLAWGGNGAAAGQFSIPEGIVHGPRGIAVDLDGNMYVSDTNNWRVQELSSSGQFVAQWRLCLDGDPPCAFPDAGTDLGQFNDSRGLLATGQNDLYVADLANNRVQCLYATAVPVVPDPGAAQGASN